MELAKNLTNLCEDKNLTIAKLSRISGVKQPTLHGWTTGRTVHNLDDLKKVCNVLQVSVHFILFGTSDPHESHKETFEELLKGDFQITFKRIIPKDRPPIL